MMDNMIQRMGREEKGFTLIELLIVVAIIAILAAIAIPNFLNARSKATLANVKADMKNISTALETYQAEFSQYPANLDGLETEFMSAVPNQPAPNAADAYRYNTCDAARTGAGTVTYSLDTDDNTYGPTASATEVYVTNGAGVVEGASTTGANDCAP